MDLFVSVDRIQKLLGLKEIQMKMSFELLHKVPAGTIEMLFDDQNQPLFKRADLGKYISIEDIKNNSKDFLSHYARPKLGLD